MGSRKGFTASMAQIQRDLERQRREQIKTQAAAMRAREQAERAAERALKADQRERAQLHTAARIEETDALNAELAARLEDLASILKTTLDVDDFRDLETMKESFEPEPFNPGPLGVPSLPPSPDSFVVAPLTGVRKMMPGAKAAHEQAVADAQRALERALDEWRSADERRLQRIAEANAAYDVAIEAEAERVHRQHAEVDAFIAAFNASDHDAVITYFRMVLEASLWPDGFPQTMDLAFDGTSKLLAIDYTLPSLEIVPTVKAYKYTKTRDAIDTTAATAASRRDLYASVVSQSALRVLHEILESDRSGIVETVALNCHVDTIDLATGKRTRPCILSVRTTRDTFNEIDLARVDPALCLKGLSAAVSPNPAELTAVRPVLELRMVDPRFVAEEDVLSSLDQRPNLMELSPGEFESLITNLFMKMGLESRQTQASRDGGVDCVAYDPRPIFGGKVVIQAKRYKHTVGVSAVRDLYGTMQNEGASKGILVTTSGYGKASFEFADGKPIELLSGPNLLYLLEEHAGIKARIMVPENWKDAVVDLADPPAAIALPPPPPSEPGSTPHASPFPFPEMRQR